MPRTQHPAVEGARVRQSLAPHNVIAEFADMRSARLAVEALGNAGIEGDSISLTGPAADRADTASPEDSLAASREIDARMAKHVIWVIGVWTVAGVIAGAILGVPVSIGILATLGAEITLERVLLGMFFTALAVGIVAWLIPHTSYPLQAAPPWELTFAESAEGGVKVGVHSDKTEVIEHAEQMLLKHKPFRLYRARPDGTPL